MKLLIVCDQMNSPAMLACVQSYSGVIHPDVTCFAPNFTPVAGLPAGFTRWTDVIGSGHEFNGIWLLGHGNVSTVGGLDHSHIATLVNDVKDPAGCTVTLVACGTGDENQLLLHASGAHGFQAGTLVQNVAQHLGNTDHVVGATVAVPMDAHAPLPSNPAQGQVVKKPGAGK